MDMRDGFAMIIFQTKRKFSHLWSQIMVVAACIITVVDRNV